MLRYLVVISCFAVLVETTGNSQVEACNDEECPVILELLDDGRLRIEYHGESFKLLRQHSGFEFSICI